MIPKFLFLGLLVLLIYHFFIHLVSNKSQAHVRVTAYSKEGYPIIFELTYDAKNLICTIDNTRNLYGWDFLKRTEIFETIQVDSNNDVFLVTKEGVQQWIFQLKDPLPKVWE